MDPHLERYLEKLEARLVKIETNDLHHVNLDLTTIKLNVGTLTERSAWLEKIIWATFFVGIAATLASGVTALPRVIAWLTT